MADFIKDTLEKIPGVDPRVAQRAQTMSGLNEGPASHAARIAGLVQEKDEIDDSPYYTSNFGQVLPAPGYTYNIGGMPTQADAFLLEKQQAFDRSKIQERIVHPCGSSAFGYFQVTQDVSKWTKAEFLQFGKKTPAYTRFSTVTYGREFPDVGRNPRGFATKFYTGEGNFDLVGLRSRQHSIAAEASKELPAGYGCHTFKMVNADGDQNYVKFHWRCHQEKERFDWEETEKIQGVDPDYSKRELFELIENGGSVKWTMYLQVMNPDDLQEVDFDPFDVTKVWPRGQFPMHEVGDLVLNRNPEDYHRDVEQAAFSPGSLVPGIELSPDTLFQWRAFFYRDAQYHRLGSANIHQIPVNCPFMAKFHSPDNYNGNMRIDANHGGKPPYFPNSYSSGHPGNAPTNTKMSKRVTPGFDPSKAESSHQLMNNVQGRQSVYRHEGDPSEYTQVRELYERVMTDKERSNLHSNTAKLLKFADGIVQKDYLIQLYAVHPTYAKSIFDLLPEHKDEYTLEEIAEASKTAHLVNKDQRFWACDKGRSFMGMPYKATVA